MIMVINCHRMCSVLNVVQQNCSISGYRCPMLVNMDSPDWRCLYQLFRFGNCFSLFFFFLFNSVSILPNIHFYPFTNVLITWNRMKNLTKISSFSRFTFHKMISFTKVTFEFTSKHFRQKREKKVKIFLKKCHEIFPSKIFRKIFFFFFSQIFLSLQKQYLNFSFNKNRKKNYFAIHTRCRSFNE